MKLIWVLLILGSLFAAQAVYWIIVSFAERQRDELRRRLREVGIGESVRNPLLRPNRMATSDGLHELLSSTGLFDSLATLLTQSDLSWTVASLLGYSVMGAAGGALVGVALAKPALVLLLAIAGAAAPTITALHSRHQRTRTITAQLPEALDLITRSLKAGHAMPTAFKLAAHELPTPIATEFARAYEEQVLGSTLEQSVQNICERVPGNFDLRIFAVSIVIQRQVGGNVAEILERISGTVRERHKFHGTLRALSAEGRISGYILGSLPLIVLAALWTLQQEYLMGMWRDPTGKMFAIGALVWWLIGIAWIRRIINVEL